MRARGCFQLNSLLIQTTITIGKYQTQQKKKQVIEITEIYKLFRHEFISYIFHISVIMKFRTIPNHAHIYLIRKVPI